MEVSHLQFADNTVVFCDTKAEEIDSLKAMLRWFEMISGLKIEQQIRVTPILTKLRLRLSNEKFVSFLCNLLVFLRA